MLAVVQWAFLALAALAAPAAGEDVEIFLAGHSHCDPGWLQTFTGYHSSSVNQILDNVVRDLTEVPRRRFIWAEQSFFQRWYDVQPARVRDDVRALVASGRLEFAEGGWVQSDEASTHPVSLIDHITEGHDYIMRNFGVRPRIAWQIDPFGHSSLTPTLFAQMGMEALVTNRIHYSLKSDLKARGKMEFFWAPSASLGDSAGIVTHVLHTHYSAPKGFDFEEGWSSVRVTAGNVAQRARVLADECKARARSYPTKKLFVPWGDDFKFRNSQTQWSQMDQIVDYINSNNLGVKIRYSTLSEYFHAVSIAQPNLFTFRGDFFPYADNGQSYWTGYYTSKPLTKLVIRETMAKIRAAEAFVALSHGLRALGPSQHRDAVQRIRALRRELGLAQHHDAITGTSRKMVDDDYKSRLWAGAGRTDAALAGAVAAVLRGPSSAAEAAAAPAAPAAPAAAAPAGAEPKLLVDPRRAGSPVGALASDQSSSTGTPALDESHHGAVVVANSLGWSRDILVRVSRLPDLKVAVVLASTGACVVSQLEHAWRSGPGEHAGPDEDEGPIVTFIARAVPAMGATTYLVVPGTAPAAKSLAAGCWAAWAETTVHTASGTNVVRGARGGAAGDGMGKIAFKGMRELRDIQSGTIVLGLGSRSPERITNKAVITAAGKPMSMPFRHSIAEYTTHKSGSYIFNPTGPAVESRESIEAVRVIRGVVTEEAHYCTSGIIRKYVLVGGANPSTDAASEILTDGVYVSLDRVTAGQNKEVVQRFHTGLKTQGAMYTDNGHEYRLRSPFNPGSPVPRQASGADIARRFYPSINGAYIGGGRHRLTVITDHSQGVTSLAEGTLELMMARQLMQDDGRGLSQPNHDTAVFQSRYKVLFGPGTSARRHILEFNNPASLFLVDRGGTAGWPAELGDYAKTFGTVFAPLQAGALPPNVHVLSLAPRDAATGDVVLRLHNVDELPDVKPGAKATFTVNTMFEPYLKMKNIRRKKLSLSQSFDEPSSLPQTFNHAGGDLALQFDPKPPTGGGVSQNTEEEGVFLSDAAMQQRVLLGSADSPDAFVLDLAPMQIASFLVTLHATGSASGRATPPAQGGGGGGGATAAAAAAAAVAAGAGGTAVPVAATTNTNAGANVLGEPKGQAPNSASGASTGTKGSAARPDSDRPAAPHKAAGAAAPAIDGGDDDEVPVPREGDLIGLPPVSRGGNGGGSVGGGASSGNGAAAAGLGNSNDAGVARAPGVLPIIDDDGDAPPFAKGAALEMGSGSEAVRRRVEREVKAMDMFRHKDVDSNPGGGEFFIVLGLTAIGLVIMFFAFFRLTRTKRVRLMD